MGERFQPMDSAPRDGTVIEVRHADGEPDLVFYAETRSCMLGPRNGAMGEGWVSVDAGNLPVDDPIEWRPTPPEED